MSEHNPLAGVPAVEHSGLIAEFVTLEKRNELKPVGGALLEHIAWQQQQLAEANAQAAAMREALQDALSTTAGRDLLNRLQTAEARVERLRAVAKATAALDGLDELSDETFAIRALQALQPGDLGDE